MNVFDAKLFGERLRSVRGPRSQAEMAQLLGMKQQLYARYEGGITIPSSKVLFMICNVVGKSSDWLLGLSEEGSASQPETGSGGSAKSRKRANAS